MPDKLITYDNLSEFKSLLSQIIATKQNVLVSGTNVKTVDGNSIVGSGNVASVKMVETTWAALKALRDGGNLIPGMQYRITDYACTTTQENTQSAGHAFDVIVTADSSNKLNEKARAAHHSGDMYFSSNTLEAWQLWYCLDNDTNRFAWADSTNGKGVIYRMIDEFGNDVPYDFKNIIYIKRPSVYLYISAGPGYYSTFDRKPENDTNGLYAWYSSYSNYGGANYYYTDTETPTTSSTVYTSNGGVYSTSAIKQVYLDAYSAYTFFKETDYTTKAGTDASIYGRLEACYSNIVKKYSVQNSTTQRLNRTIFYAVYGSGLVGFFDNFIDQNNHDNILNKDFNQNIIGQSFHDNVINSGFAFNTIGDNFYSNTVKSNCKKNNISSYFYQNSVEANFYYNDIQNYVYENTIDHDFTSNDIKHDFHHNTVGAYFSANSIGCYVAYCTFGERFSSNVVLGSMSNCQITFFTKQSLFENGLSYISLSSLDTVGNSFNYLKKVHICVGVSGSSSSNLLALTVDDRNLEYETVFRTSGSVEYLM